MKIKQLSIVLIIAIAICLHAPTASAKKPHTPEKCDQTTQTVTLSSSDPTSYEITGWLCYRGNLHNKTVLFTISGLTYDHNYWQWPQNAKKYSFVRAATKTGYAVFTIDRLGTGLSAHPTDPDSLTTQSEAYVTHQLIQKLRGGEIKGTAFQKIVLVGHSYGSQVIKYEAATYADSDAAIITGALHETSSQIVNIMETFYPAIFDPKFATSGLELGYLTTIPGTRSFDFYNLATTDPAVISKDEELKETATTGELATITDAEALTPQIHVPVLLVMGENDRLFCDETLSCADETTILNREQTQYSPDTCLEAYVLPESGHSINLHTNTSSWYHVATHWLDRRVGTNEHAPTDPCTS